MQDGGSVPDGQGSTGAETRSCTYYGAHNMIEESDIIVLFFLLVSAG